jgi:hypothetical protein
MPSLSAALDRFIRILAKGISDVACCGGLQSLQELESVQVSFNTSSRIGRFECGLSGSFCEMV